MSIFQGLGQRGGTRGGKDQFKWEDLKGDKKGQEYYLGHSIKLDGHDWWVSGRLRNVATNLKHDTKKTRNSKTLPMVQMDEQLRTEFEEQKQRDIQMMNEALGYVPKQKREPQKKLEKHEFKELLRRGTLDDEDKKMFSLLNQDAKGLGTGHQRASALLLPEQQTEEMLPPADLEQGPACGPVLGPSLPANFVYDESSDEETRAKKQQKNKDKKKKEKAHKKSKKEKKHKKAKKEKKSRNSHQKQDSPHSTIQPQLDTVDHQTVRTDSAHHDQNYSKNASKRLHEKEKPTNDKYDDKHRDEKRYDDKRYDEKRYDDKRYDDKRYDEKRYDEKRYDEKRYDDRSSHYYKNRHSDDRDRRNDKYDDKRRDDERYDDTRNGNRKYERHSHIRTETNEKKERLDPVGKKLKSEKSE